MAEEIKGRHLVFNGQRTTWFAPASLPELLQLKATYPEAPLVVGNTNVGKLQDCCVIASEYTQPDVATLMEAIECLQ